MKLLTRDEFRNQCLKRDNYKCLFCDSENNLSVHHIVERRLFKNGGYYLENGSTLCEVHHILAEETNLSCEEIREKAEINKIILPEHLYDEYTYTKWGDIVQSNGRRLKGELFFDESVQKILKQGNVLNLYDKYIKYPRTFHLPWSNPTKDDKIIKTLEYLENKQVVVTLKMDGENFTGYSDFCHARSLAPLYGDDRGIAKSIWASVSHDIPEGFRFCAENLYAKHSIHYSDLDSYLQVFSIWNERNECLSWDETKEWCELLGLNTVPVIYQGIWDKSAITESFESYKNDHEGYVVRLADEFKYTDFKQSVAKFVRKGHIQPNSHHWRSKAIIPNVIKKS